MSERLMTLGPTWDEWTQIGPRGDCPDCGGDCDGGECGNHAAGCVYGGPSDATGYWLYVEECPRWHGDSEQAPPKDDAGA